MSDPQEAWTDVEREKFYAKPRIAVIGNDWDRKELAKLVVALKESGGQGVAELHSTATDPNKHLLTINGVTIFTFEMHDEEKEYTTDEEDFHIHCLTKHQLATLVSVSDHPLDTSFQGVHETRDETICYESGNGWWAGYSGLDGQTAHALIRAGMITCDDSISGETQYYKLTRLGKIAAQRDIDWRKESGLL